MKPLAILLVVALCPGCFWRIWTNRRDEHVRNAAAPVLQCPVEVIELSDQPGGRFRALGCNRVAICSDEVEGEWRCAPALY